MKPTYQGVLRSMRPFMKPPADDPERSLIPVALDNAYLSLILTDVGAFCDAHQGVYEAEGIKVIHSEIDSLGEGLQIFFTDRAPGEYSELLLFYPVDREEEATSNEVEFIYWDVELDEAPDEGEGYIARFNRMVEDITWLYERLFKVHLDSQLH